MVYRGMDWLLVSVLVPALVEVVDSERVHNVSRIAQNKTVPCVPGCRMQDSDLDVCWSQSLLYHTTALAEQLQSFSSALLHVNYWKEVNGYRPNDPIDDPETFNKINSFELKIIESVVERLGRADEVSIDEWNPVLSADTLRDIMIHIFNVTVSVRSRYDELLETSEHLPHLSCPTRCDYYPPMWTSLFAVTLTILILFTLFALLYAIYMVRGKTPRGDSPALLSGVGTARSSIT